jgi:FG-GAP repeat protein
LLVRYVDGEYTVDVIDHDLGPANCMVYRHDGSDYIVAAYRETDQLALYKVVE